MQSQLEAEAEESRLEPKYPGQTARCPQPAPRSTYSMGQHDGQRPQLLPCSGCSRTHPDWSWCAQQNSIWTHKRILNILN